MNTSSLRVKTSSDFWTFKNLVFRLLEDKKWRISWIDHWMILSDQREEEVAAVVVEEEAADLEGAAADSAEEDEGVEGDQAAAHLQEFVPFSYPRVAVCVEKVQLGCKQHSVYNRHLNNGAFCMRLAVGCSTEGF